jgi:hypothetical protein
MKTFFMIFQVSFIAFLMVIPLNAMPDNPNNPDSSVINKRLHLIAQNDSIDLLKQSYKRKGLPLTELEEKQDSIHDTLKSINKQIQNSKPSSVQTSLLLDLISYIPMKPNTIFDWIIIIVGIIAVISGLFLIFGIFSMAASRKKATQKKKSLQYNTPAPHKTPAPATQPIDELRALAKNTSDSVHQLRRQLKNTEYEKNAPAPEPVKPHPEEEMPPLLLSDQAHKNDAQIEHKIIDAASNGLNPQEISKKFHISTDQISLILKVAGIKPKKTDYKKIK